MQTDSHDENQTTPWENHLSGLEILLAAQQLIHTFFRACLFTFFMCYVYGTSTAERNWPQSVFVPLVAINECHFISILSRKPSNKGHKNKSKIQTQNTCMYVYQAKLNFFLCIFWFGDVPLSMADQTNRTFVSSSRYLLSAFVPYDRKQFNKHDIQYVWRPGPNQNKLSQVQFPFQTNNLDLLSSDGWVSNLMKMGTKQRIRFNFNW